MSKGRSRVGVVFGAVVGGLLLAGVATAWACVALASVELTPGKAASGSQVTAKLSNFNTSDPTFSAVELHWGSINGPVLASALGPQLAASGNKMNFIVPDGEAGNYVVIATQYDSSGAPAFGTPARATLTVPGRPPGVAPTEAAPAAPIVEVKQRYVVDKAPASPAAAAPAAPARPLEAQDAITERVAPVAAREVSYVPASERRTPSSMPARAGLGLAAAGAMALLTAASAVVVVRRVQPDSFSRNR